MCGGNVADVRFISKIERMKLRREKMRKRGKGGREKKKKRDRNGEANKGDFCVPFSSSPDCVGGSTTRRYTKMVCFFTSITTLKTPLALQTRMSLFCFHPAHRYKCAVFSSYFSTFISLISCSNNIIILCIDPH